MRMNRAPLLLCVVLTAFLVGCGGSRSDNYTGSAPPPAAAPMAEANVQMAQSESYSYNNTAYDMAYSSDESGILAKSVDASAQEQKIILEAELSMATDRFDEVSARIRSIAAENDGYVQNSEQYTAGDQRRRFIITIRVPYEQYEFVVTQIKGLCALISASENQRNVTAEYYDIQSRLQTKLIEEERLLELIGRAESIEDILELESLLGQVRTQIEVYQTQMTSIDRLSSYSTINVYLDEVMDETTVIIPTNLSEKVYASFIQSVNSTIRFTQGVVIFLVRISAPLFVALVAAAIIWGLFKIRGRMKHRREGSK